MLLEKCVSSTAESLVEGLVNQDWGSGNVGEWNRFRNNNNNNPICGFCLEFIRNHMVQINFYSEHENDVERTNDFIYYIYSYLWEGFRVEVL